MPLEHIRSLAWDSPLTLSWKHTVTAPQVSLLPTLYSLGQVILQRTCACLRLLLGPDLVSVTPTARVQGLRARIFGVGRVPGSNLSSLIV